MHTPDGFLTSWICVLLLVLSAIPVLFAVNNLRKRITKELAIKYASLAAIIFAAQMLNFPIIDGTSGHLIGAALAVILFGADAAVLIIASVLIVQVTLFGDGGALALGANVFNMAIVGTYSAQFVYNKTKNVFLSSWTSVVAASLSCAILLGLSGTIDITNAIIAMVSVHAIIGIGEGLITIIMLNVLKSTNKITLKILANNLALETVALSILGLALLLPFASTNPDGLERVAVNLGFYEKATNIFEAPITDYSISLLSTSAYLATLIAGAIGTISVFAVAYAGFGFMKIRN